MQNYFTWEKFYEARRRSLSKIVQLWTEDEITTKYKSRSMAYVNTVWNTGNMLVIGIWHTSDWQTTVDPSFSDKGRSFIW